jgi:hypothetical protein
MLPLESVPTLTEEAGRKQRVVACRILDDLGTDLSADLAHQPVALVFEIGGFRALSRGVGDLAVELRDL